LSENLFSIFHLYYKKYTLFLLKFRTKVEPTKLPLIPFSCTIERD
jgi:hypothetical protein